MWNHLHLLYFDSSLNQIFSQKNISIVKLCFSNDLCDVEKALICVYVFTERLIGLPDSMLKNHNRPQIIPALEGVFIEDIAVGCEHILALSNTGDVYAWGCNCEAQVQSAMMFNDVFCGYLGICEYLVELTSSLCVLQLGLGHSNPVKEPALVTALQGKNIRQISAGRCHTSAWTTPALSTRASGTNKSQWAALETHK